MLALLTLLLLLAQLLLLVQHPLLLLLLVLLLLLLALVVVLLLLPLMLHLSLSLLGLHLVMVQQLRELRPDLCVPCCSNARPKIERDAATRTQTLCQRRQREGTQVRRDSGCVISLVPLSHGPRRRQGKGVPGRRSMSMHALFSPRQSSRAAPCTACEAAVAQQFAHCVVQGGRWSGPSCHRIVCVCRMD